MNSPSAGIFIFILYIILVWSGVKAIRAGLRQLNNPKAGSPTSDSTLQTIWFKWYGPAGLIYGAIAIISVIFMAKSDFSTEYPNMVVGLQSRIKDLEEENAYFRAVVKDSSKYSRYTFTADIYRGSTPLFGGTVLLTYDGEHFIFKGVKGVSRDRTGPFYLDTIDYKDGDKFYLKLDSDQVWGVNVYTGYTNNITHLFLQFYRT